MASEPGAPRRFTSPSPEATEALGAALGAVAPPGLVVVLAGDLGAGKTCFVRGLARGLGIAGPVTSPSFALMNSYEGRLPLLHFDAWMEGRERAFLADGGEEVLGGEAVCAIEWGERVAEALPGAHLVLRLEHVGPAERRLELEAVGDPGLARLVAALPVPEGLVEA